MHRAFVDAAAVRPDARLLLTHDAEFLAAEIVGDGEVPLLVNAIYWRILSPSVCSSSTASTPLFDWRTTSSGRPLGGRRAAIVLELQRPEILRRTIAARFQTRQLGAALSSSQARRRLFRVLRHTRLPS